MTKKTPHTHTESPWQGLKKYTDARIALGRCGHSIPTQELLDFKLAHAKAMDAVHQPLDFQEICSAIENLTGLPTLHLHSAATGRNEYLQRPDLGRILSPASIHILEKLEKKAEYDISLVVADGLSSTAIEANILPMFRQLLPEIQNKGLSIAPITVVEQARVAIGDPIAELLPAKLTVVFIGERPGLQSPNSLGIYMTYHAKSGTTDERRNCISNVRKGGLSYPIASFKLLYLIEEAFKRKISGVDLKDESNWEALGGNKLGEIL